MNTAPFPVQRSLLSTSALVERVLTKYDLPETAACYFWHRGINDSYLIKAGERRWMLRISPTNWRSYEHIQTEIALLQFLPGHSIATPQPLPQRDGTYIQPLLAPEGLRYGLLFTFVPGAKANPMTDAYGYQYGQAIARFHLATDAFPADRACFRFDPQRMVDEPLARLKPFFANRQADFDYLLQIAPRLKRAATQLPDTAPVFGLCHGDVNKSNIHFMEQNNWVLLDFEYIGYGWRVFDLANFINNEMIFGQSEESQKLCDAFLEGYQSVRSLSEVELEALPAFVLLRQFWLWGVGVRNLPNYSFQMFEDWVFEYGMRFVRTWVAEVW